MKFSHGLLFCIVLFSAAGAHASDGPITKGEFDHLVAHPFKASHATSGNTVEIHLKPDGSVVARQDYNDIGTWRRDGDAGYCVRWNKQRFDERCSYFVKRDGKLALDSQNGELAWWIEGSQK